MLMRDVLFFGVPFFEQEIKFRVSLLVKSQMQEMTLQNHTILVSKSAYSRLLYICCILGGISTYHLTGTCHFG